MINARGFYADAGSRIDELGGVLRCNACKREMPARNAGKYLREGWPECHGYTMELVTQRLLDQEATPSKPQETP